MAAGRYLQDAKTDPNGNPSPYAVLSRANFGSHANAVMERFGTEEDARARGQFLTDRGMVVEVMMDIAYTVNGSSGSFES